MSFRSYPEIKYSNTEWLGSIPSHWNLKRLGFFFNERREKVNDRDFPPLSVTKHGVVPQLETAAKSDDSDNRKKVCVGDFVINSRSDRKGSSGVSTLTGSVSLINTVLVASENMNSRFVHHLFRSSGFQDEFYRFGKGIVADLWSTNFSEMKNILIAIPPFNEQTQIANFLDSEVNKIDAMIAEQEKLILLLKEKCKAIISHAVIKGTNLAVSLKDSEVNWMGEIPTHWRISRICYEAWVRARLGWKGLKAEEYVDDGYIFLATPNIKDSEIDFIHVNYINRERYEESPEIMLAEGDILLTKDGSTLGTVNLVRKLPKPATVNSSIAVITPKKNLNSEFLLYFFKSNYIENTIQLLKGGMGVPHLFQGDINKIHIPIPPIKEQLAIVNFLDPINKNIKNLIDQAIYKVKLLHERRSVLISAAVTGQIDVRNFQFKEAA
jgi:type I restriction enzyme S subunit